MTSYLERYYFIQKANELNIPLYDLNLKPLNNLNRSVEEVLGDIHAC